MAAHMDGSRSIAFAVLLVSSSLVLAPTASAQVKGATPEELAALLWLNIADGAELNGDRAVRISRSPAAFDTLRARTKERTARITVTKLTPCTYHYAMVPASANVRDQFGDPVAPSEWKVDFSRVSGIQGYSNEPNLIYYAVEGPPMCEDVGDGRICTGSYPRPLNGPPAKQARPLLAQFQKDVCRPTK